LIASLEIYRTPFKSISVGRTKEDYGLKVFSLNQLVGIGCNLARTDMSSVRNQESVDCPFGRVFDFCVFQEPVDLP